MELFSSRFFLLNFDISCTCLLLKFVIKGAQVLFVNVMLYDYARDVEIMESCEYTPSFFKLTG